MYKSQKFLYVLLSMILVYHANSFAETTTIICKQGKYLASCGNYAIGTNWLKPTRINDITTGNYYSGNTNDDMKNLRIFFDNDDNASIEFTNSTDTFPYATYSADRNKLLSAFCDGENIKCADCPNGGTTTEASTKTTDDTNGTNWHVNSIANCYMQEFSDATGTYIYENTDNNAENCYYSKETSGNELPDTTNN